MYKTTREKNYWEEKWPSKNSSKGLGKYQSSSPFLENSIKSVSDSSRIQEA